jgi:predicted transcriptional regulator
VPLWIDTLTHGDVHRKLIWFFWGGDEMKLTQRRKDFLDCLINLYNRTAKPVHYETLAREVGVSKWTAYDMLQALEKTGFLVRQYALHSQGIGRSQIVYVPTESAYGIVGKSRTDSDVTNSVESAMVNFIGWTRRIQTEDIIEEIMEAIQTAPSQVEYCSYVLGLLVIVLRGTNEETVRFIKHFVLQTPSESMRLATFTGAVFGNVVTSINSELSLQVVDLIGEFLKQVNGLSDESKSLLSEFLVQTLSST